jgi:HEPN domain-containing protein
MKDKRDLARGWLTKAESDLVTARLMLDTSGPYDTACFHAQQAVEKVLKGFLAFHELAIPRTHDLEELQRLCLGACGLQDIGDLDLTQLTDYAVLTRYDFEFWPDRATAAEAVTVAEQVRRAVLDALPRDCYPGVLQ